jgi:hypothetical protein
MYNTNVFFGTDGELTLSTVAEGSPAGETITTYLGESGVVGRVINVTLRVTMQLKPFHELGSRAPKELRAGNIAVSGTVERAHLNGALLKLMLGQYASEEETTPFAIPSFNMAIALDNVAPQGDAAISALKVYGVKFDSWQFNLPEDDFVLEHLTFKALRIQSTDTELE